MKMIGHQAIRVHLPAGLKTGLPERTQKPASILFILEDRFTAIPAIHHMINRADVLHSQLPGYTTESAWPSKNCQLSGPTPFQLSGPTPFQLSGPTPFLFPFQIKNSQASART